MIALCFRRLQSSTHRSAEEKPVLGAPESTRNFFGNDDLVNIRNANVLVRGDRLDRAIQRRREFQASSQASFQGESILASDWPQVRAAPQDLRSSGIETAATFQLFSICKMRVHQNGRRRSVSQSPSLL